jgi:membrane fusion protein (multidrug efflux system)
MKKKIAFFVLLFVLLIGIAVLVKYILFNERYVSSNAAFVKSDTLTNLAFKLPGKIEKIYVKEGQKVKKGQLLAKLDTKELEITQKELLFSVKSLQNKIAALSYQKNKLQKDINDSLKLNSLKLKKLQKSIEAKKYAVLALEAKFAKLKKDYDKFKNLYLKKKISEEKYDAVKSAYLALKNDIKAQKAILNGMKVDESMLLVQKDVILSNNDEVKRLSKTIKALKNSLNALKEKLAFVRQKIKDSYLYAPFDATVAKKFANNDEVVPAGWKVLSIVNTDNLYVLDLLEETKMKDIGPGCPVTVHIDALDKDFKGVVSSILPASAATFALVPRDISSGEFTKLAQRFYVRIKFDKTPKGAKVGMSAEVTIEKCKK